MDGRPFRQVIGWNEQHQCPAESRMTDGELQGRPAAADVLRAAGVGNIAGKAVMDATNPIADAPPSSGVLKFFTNHEESLMEQLQRGSRAPVLSRRSVQLAARA